MPLAASGEHLPRRRVTKKRKSILASIRVLIYDTTAKASPPARIRLADCAVIGGMCLRQNRTMFKQLLASKGDRARQWAINTTLTITVVGGGYFLCAAWTRSGQPAAGSWLCMDCAYSADKVPQLGEDIPARCPRCGKSGFIPAYACPQCKQPLILNTYRGLPEPTRCSVCGQEVRYGR